MTSGRAALFVVLVVAALAASGCGGSGSGRAKAVRSYLEHVNLVQEQLAVPLSHVSRANQELRMGRPIQKLGPKLEESAATIQRLQHRLDALDPPPDATRLAALIHRLIQSEWQLTREFVSLARYTPAAAPIIARAATAGKAVRNGLAASRKPKPQADALDAYATALDGIVRDLRKLDPPPVVAPQHRTQLRTYSRLASSARELAAALRAGKQTEVRDALHSVEVAAVSGSSLAAQKARIAGIVAFNGRVKRVTALAAAAQRERNRLQRLLA